LGQGKEEEVDNGWGGKPNRRRHGREGYSPKLLSLPWVLLLRETRRGEGKGGGENSHSDRKSKSKVGTAEGLESYFNHHFTPLGTEGGEKRRKRGNGKGKKGGRDTRLLQGRRSKEEGGYL